MRMFQATAAGFAVALAIIAMPAEAKMSCATLKRFTSGYTAEQLEQMADNYGLSVDQKAGARACLAKKRRR